MTAFETEELDIGTDRLGHPEPVQREQRDQGVVAGTGQSGSDEHRPDLVTVEAGRVRLIVQARSTDMHGR